MAVISGVASRDEVAIYPASLTYCTTCGAHTGKAPGMTALKTDEAVDKFACNLF